MNRIENTLIDLKIVDIFGRETSSLTNGQHGRRFNNGRLLVTSHIKYKEQLTAMWRWFQDTDTFPPLFNCFEICDFFSWWLTRLTEMHWRQPNGRVHFRPCVASAVHQSCLQHFFMAGETILCFHQSCVQHFLSREKPVLWQFFSLSIWVLAGNFWDLGGDSEHPLH